MTREEAIWYLTPIAESASLERYKEALSMAVAALREQEERRWIPVADMLPEESGMYIVTANDGHAQRVSFVLWQKKNRMWNLTGARSYWMVTHWQPMPQPPKEAF